MSVGSPDTSGIFTSVPTSITETGEYHTGPPTTMPTLQPTIVPMGDVPGFTVPTNGISNNPTHIIVPMPANPPQESFEEHGPLLSHGINQPDSQPSKTNVIWTGLNGDEEKPLPTPSTAGIYADGSAHSTLLTVAYSIQADHAMATKTFTPTASYVVTSVDGSLLTFHTIFPSTPPTLAATLPEDSTFHSSASIATNAACHQTKGPIAAISAITSLVVLAGISSLL